MKYFSFIIITILFCSTLNAQNIELRLGSGIGLSQDNFETSSGWLNKEHRQKSFDFQVDGNYYFLNKNKFNAFAGLGLGFNRKAFQYDIESIDFGYSINSVVLSQDFISLPIRLGLEYKFSNENAIGFQFELSNNFDLNSEEQVISSDFNSAIRGSLEYDYTFGIQSKNHISLGLSIYSKTKLSDNLYLTTSFGIVENGESGIYSHNSNQIQTLTNQDSGQQRQLQSSFQSNDNAIEFDFITFKIGISKYF